MQRTEESARPRVRITACFDNDDVVRTGLRLGAVVEVAEGAFEGDTRFWVKCPEINRRKRDTGHKIERRVSGTNRLWSDGYTTLGVGEYEEL